MSRKNVLNRNVIGLGLTSLLTDVSTESAYAILPFYTVFVLGIRRDIAGFIEGVGELVSSLSKLAGGWIASRVGRYKKLALLGYSLSTIAKPFLAVTSYWIHVLAVKIMDRVGKGIRTSPRDTLLSVSVSSREHGRVFGLHRSMDTVGAILGPFTAFLLLPLVGYRGVFLFTLVPGAIALLVLSTMVDEGRAGAPARSRLPVELCRREGQAGIPRQFLAFLVVSALTGLAGYTHVFLLLRVSEIGWSSGDALLLLTLANTVYASTSYPAGFLGDRLGYRKLYSMSLLIGVAGALAVVCMKGYCWGILYFTLYGLYLGFNNTMARALTSYYVSGKARAKAYGYTYGVHGFSTLTGYYVVGYLYETAGAETAFLYTSITLLTGFFASLALIQEKV